MSSKYISLPFQPKEAKGLFQFSLAIKA